MPKFSRFSDCKIPQSISIYLDDVRDTPEGFIRTYSSEETKELLQECCCKGIKVETLSLDNDLGVGYEQGYNVALWLEYQVISNHFPIPEKMIAHTSSPEAKQLMNVCFRNIARHCKEKQTT